MRTAVFGSQLVIKNNKFIGVNLGYNFISEHDGDLKQLVMNINKSQINPLTYATLPPFQKMRVNKDIKAQKTIISRWSKTPFAQYMIFPKTPYFKREIIINNDNSHYKKYLTTNGNYTLLIIGTKFDKESWYRKFGAKRKFSEDELLTQDDYNIDNRENVKYNLAISQLNNNETPVFVGSWEFNDDSIMLLVNKDICEYNIVDSIIRAMQCGNLAVYDGEQRLFYERGCQLIDLEAAYLPQR